MTVSSWQSTEAAETHRDGIPSMLSFGPLWNNSCRSLISVGLIIWEKWTRNQSRGVPNYPAGACKFCPMGNRKKEAARSNIPLGITERWENPLTSGLDLMAVCYRIGRLLSASPRTSLFSLHCGNKSIYDIFLKSPGGEGNIDAFNTAIFYKIWMKWFITHFTWLYEKMWSMLLKNH